jgi:hypothetical protein
MKPWNLKVFISNRGDKEFEVWLNGQPKGARAKIRKILTYLEAMQTWGRPYAAKRKDAKNIWEIIVGFDNIQYRPLGCFAPNREFILLIGATEKGGRLEPLNAVEIAIKRRSLALKDRRYIDEYYETSPEDNRGPEG